MKNDIGFYSVAIAATPRLADDKAAELACDAGSIEKGAPKSEEHLEAACREVKRRKLIRQLYPQKVTYLDIARSKKRRRIIADELMAGDDSGTADPEASDTALQGVGTADSGAPGAFPGAGTTSHEVPVSLRDFEQRLADPTGDVVAEKGVKPKGDEPRDLTFDEWIARGPEKVATKCKVPLRPKMNFIFICRCPACRRKGIREAKTIEYSKFTFRAAREGVQLKEQHVVLDEHGFVSYDHPLPQGQATRGKRSRLRSHLRDNNAVDFQFPRCAGPQEKPKVKAATAVQPPASDDSQDTLKKMLDSYQSLFEKYEAAPSAVAKEALTGALEHHALAIAQFLKEDKK